MDTYTEHIIKQKYSFKAILMTFGLYLLATVLSVVTVTLAFSYPLVMQFAFALVVGYYVGAWFITQKFNIEYEYIVTNDELDVDKIMSRKTRKRMLTVSARKFDEFGKAEGPRFEELMKNPEIQVKFDASISKKSDGRFYALFVNKKEQKMLLIFNPTEKMLKMFRIYNPEKVGNYD